MSVASFAEESVWSGQQFRPTRNSVVFRVTSIGKIAGRRVDLEMVSDYGVWFDPDDVQLLESLSRAEPGIPWGSFVFWRRQDVGSIDIIDQDSDRVIGSIVVRRRLGGDPSGEIDWTNVVMPVKWRREK
jgi:hypothetical protein